MSLDDERKKLEGEIADQNSLGISKDSSLDALPHSLDQEMERLQADVAREEEFYQVIEQGRLALLEKNYQKARVFFERAELLKPGAPEARDGLVQSLYQAGMQAESRRFLGRLSGLPEAADYYQALLKFEPNNPGVQVRLKSVSRALILSRILLVVLLSVVVLGCTLSGVIALKANDWFYWSAGVCQDHAFGSVLCTPVPTSTSIMTATATVTNSPTPTVTFTPTITLTPVYVQVWVNRNSVIFYRFGTGIERNGAVANIYAQFYICSPISSEGRVLLAPGLCHTTTPTGWVAVKFLEYGALPENSTPSP